MYNATSYNLNEFIESPRVGTENGNDISLVYWQFALNENTSAVFGVMEFDGYLRDGALYRSLADRTFASIRIDTFKNNDANNSAALAVNNTRRMAAKEGFVSVSSPDAPEGAPKSKLLAKADEMWAEDERKAAEQREGEFDAKTAAAIKQSVDEGNKKLDAIGTSTGALKSSVDKIGDQLLIDYNDLVANQALTMRTNERMLKSRDETIKDQQKTIQDQHNTITDQWTTIAHLETARDDAEARAYRQSVVLAKLNAEKTAAATELRAKNKKIQDLQDTLLQYVSRGGGNKRGRN
jgi:hypothetical protein